MFQCCGAAPDLHSFPTRRSSDLEARASSAFDGDPSTAWSPPFAGPSARWVEATLPAPVTFDHLDLVVVDRKSTRLNSSHQIISYAAFCLKKKKTYRPSSTGLRPT